MPKIDEHMLNWSKLFQAQNEEHSTEHEINLINLDVKLLNESVNIFELPDVGVLRGLVLQDGQLHERLRDAVGHNASRGRHRGQRDRKEAVGQLVVDLEAVVSMLAMKPAI
jgi:hypothetical protein